MKSKSTHLKFYVKSYDKNPKVCLDVYRSVFEQVSTLNTILKGLELDWEITNT